MVLSLPPRLIAAVRSDDEPRDIAAAGNTTARTGGPYAFHPLPAAPAPIDLASAALSLPPRLIAAVRSDDEPRDIAATGNTTVRTGGPYAFHPLPAAPAPIDLASVVLSLPPRLIAALRSDDGPRDIAAAGNTTVRTGGPYAFHPLPAAPAPIDLASVVLSLPPRLIAAVPSDDEPRDIAATGNTTVRTGGRYALHALLRLAHQQIEALALTTPPGDNAYETLQRILAVMPAQPDALRGIRDIADKYEMLATELTNAANAILRRDMWKRGWR